MDIDELKRTLRKFKKLEQKIRFNSRPTTKRLIWNDFFSNHETDRKVKYPLCLLISMDKQQLKDIYDEYFYMVYYQFYKENGLSFENMYDPNLLSIMGLTPGSSLDDIKKRFRELAKKYHPDHGGDSEKIIEILDAYKKLTK